MIMEQMLTYLSCLQEVDTAGVEPLVQPVVRENVMREDEAVVIDEATGRDKREKLLRNAPCVADGFFVVPRTVE